MQDKFTPLWLASSNGAEDIVELLISAGANLHLSNKVGLAIIRQIYNVQH